MSAAETGAQPRSADSPATGTAYVDMPTRSIAIESSSFASGVSSDARRRRRRRPARRRARRASAPREAAAPHRSGRDTAARSARGAPRREGRAPREHDTRDERAKPHGQTSSQHTLYRSQAREDSSRLCVGGAGLALMSKFARKGKPPPGFEKLAPTLEALEIELREKVNESHEGKRKTEALWPVHQINWQRSRYVYDMHYKYHRVSREVYDYCVNNKIVDAALIAKWKKPGYERLCST